MDMMNILSVLIVGSPLIAVSGLPIAAHHPAPMLVTDAPLQLIEDVDFRPARFSTVQQPSPASLGYLRERAVRL